MRFRTIRRVAIPITAAFIVALAATAATAATPDDSGCKVPDSFFADEPVLGKTFALLSAGKPVGIVAIGGASTQGRAAGKPELAWPARLAAALAARFPAARIAVHNLGRPRQSADDMLARFADEIVPLHPALVIWETGTTEAVRGADPYAFRDTVQEGIDRLHRAGAEVMLMDMQFSRRAAAVIDFERYDAVLREAADLNDVPLFRRLDIMRFWVEGGMLDLNAGTGEKRRAIAARLYDCIGRAVAGLTVHGARVARERP